MDFSEKEALRYLGFRGRPADADTLSLLQEVAEAAHTCIQPKSIYKEVALHRVTDEDAEIGGIVFHSRKLQAHLKDSDRILVFAATLGANADTLVRRYAAGNTAKAAVAQAVLAAMIEHYCDEICDRIADEEAKNGYFLRPRFSPGYADLELSAQRSLFSLLEITKRIGITLTDTCLMLPTKSVTAFIGLSKTKSCKTESCEICTDTECAYRKEDIGYGIS